MSSASRITRAASGITRRTFLKLSALSGGVLIVSRFLARPAQGKVTTPPEPTEGVITENVLATSCLNCATRCATRVRVTNGRAVKISGNPLSRVSDGENCPRAHIGLQVLYDPDRLTSPVRRTNPAKGRGVDPGWRPVSWEEALYEVGTRLGDIRATGPEQLLIMTGLNTVSDEDILRRFARAYGTPNFISADGLENQADKAGQWLADGNFTQSAYDLARTNYILSFGASILESQKPLARHLRMWGVIRRERPNRAKVVVVDPRYSVTAAKADRWLPIKTGTDGALAMAIAHVIIKENLYDRDFVEKHTSGFEEYSELALKSYAPESVAALTGIGADTIREIAREFATTRPAIAWRGRGATSWPGGSYTAYAIFCLNGLVGSIDVPGGVTYQEEPPYRPLPEVTLDGAATAGLSKPRLDASRANLLPGGTATNEVADAISGKKPYAVAAAIGANCNFNMEAPGASRWDQAMKELPYYVHIGPFASEMAAYADIILPAPTFLEQWGYDHSPPGSGFAEIKLKQPVVTPLHDTMSVADAVFTLASRLAPSVAASFSGIGDGAEGFVRYRTADTLGWDKFLEEGVWVGPDYRYGKYGDIFRTPSGNFEFRSGNLETLLKESGRSADPGNLLPHHEAPRFMGEEARYPLHLSTYQPVLNVENGAQNYPWAQEVYLVMHGRGWANFAEMNSHTAHELGIKDRDWVVVESAFASVRVRARVSEGIHPEVVSIASGQGHYAYGRYSRDIGVNPNELMGVSYDDLSGQAAYYNTRVNVYRA